MSNTTDCFWSVDGVSLQTMAFNIVTLGEGREAPPPMRGEDTLVPYNVGKKRGPRIPDSKVLTLGMWVIGATENGNMPDPGTTLRQQYNTNWRKLRNLLWNQGEVIQLTKRFEDDSGNIISATAEATYAGGLEPQMGGPYRAAFTVDLLLHDPFFYSDVEIEEVFTDNETKTLDVLGDYKTYSIELEMAAGSRFTNTSENPDVWCQLSVDGTVDVKNGIVSSGSAGSLTHKGAFKYFVLSPGENVIQLTGASSTIRYREAYV